MVFFYARDIYNYRSQQETELKQPKELPINGFMADQRSSSLLQGKEK